MTPEQFEIYRQLINEVVDLAGKSYELGCLSKQVSQDEYDALLDERESVQQRVYELARELTEF